LPLEAALQALAPSGHVCSIDEHELEHLELIATFVGIGLERGEKCVFIADKGSDGRLEQTLYARGIDVREALNAKALVLMSPNEAHLEGDSLDPYRMFTLWKNLSSRAREEGFARLRGATDMQWILRAVPGSQRWLAYERNLTELAAQSQCLLLCQYRRPNFRAEHLLDVVRTHPSVIHRGTVAQNIYYVPAEIGSQADPYASELDNLLHDIRRREEADYVLRQQREEDLRRAVDAEATLRATQSELVRASRLTTLGELTASIAHEVNQPLAAIIAHGGAARRWLGRASPDVGEAEKAIEGVIANAHRARDVIARIRALARKADNQRELLDLNEIIRETLALADGELRQHSVTLRTDVAPMLPRILGDRVQLQQVVLNLIVNGVEAINSLTEGSRELAIHTFTDRDEVHVAVQDSGIGLPEEDLQTIFEPFYTTKSQGMGIGLSISRSIIQAHNGRLWAERNKDAPGITVHFTLPVREGLAANGDPDEP
jgi:signal transduction histidine kinase